MKYYIHNDWLYLTIDKKFDTFTIEAFFDYFYLSKKTRHLLIQHKEIRLNDAYVKRETLMHNQDVLAIKAFQKTSTIVCDDIQIDIAYEDEFLLVVNKPAGLLIHDDGSDDKTLSNRVEAYYKKQQIKSDVRAIHRLDQDTTGLIIFCKCAILQSYFDHELSEKHIQREYKAIVEGNLPLHKEIKVEKNIGRDRHSNKQRISKDGKYACTYITCEEQMQTFSLITCRLTTGRTHQIRVHCASLFHPILSDPLYGKSHKLIKRTALHAYKITMKHPILDKLLTITCDLPDDMKICLSDNMK